jgi:hypothetical protein
LRTCVGKKDLVADSQELRRIEIDKERWNAATSFSANPICPFFVDAMVYIFQVVMLSPSGISPRLSRRVGDDVRLPEKRFRKILAQPRRRVLRGVHTVEDVAVLRTGNGNRRIAITADASRRPERVTVGAMA